MRSNSSPVCHSERRSRRNLVRRQGDPSRSLGMTKNGGMTKDVFSDERTEYSHGLAQPKRRSREGWSPEARAAAALRAKASRPWKHSTGPRTVLGKAASSQNARKHGYRSAEIARLHAVLRLQRLFVKSVAEGLKNRVNPLYHRAFEVENSQNPVVPGVKLQNFSFYSLHILNTLLISGHDFEEPDPCFYCGHHHIDRGWGRLGDRVTPAAERGVLLLDGGV